MAKIPFDIRFRPQIESGEYKVETRDGRDARIICWDSKAKDARFDTRPIIALVTTPIPELESLIQCGENGILYKYAQDRRDLFIVTPEEELTEFEKKLREVLKSEGSPIGPIEKFTNADKEVFHSYAAELLSLARKQLQPEIDAEIEKAYKTADEVQYRKGREDALKNFPRWKKAKEYMKLGPNDFVFTLDSDGKCSPYWDTEVEEGQFYITESDIENLPKEDE